jgi:mono/diheme cytochrome c family protein
MTYSLRRLWFVTALGLAAVGCSKGADRAGGPAPSPAPSQSDFNKSRGDTTAPTQPATPITAESIFATRCATCHGTNGKGDGPAAVALNPKPRNYTDATWQKSVTDEQIKKTIVGGGASVGKSPLMVPNPDLANNDVVLDGLVKIVRGFAATTQGT